MAEHTCSVLAPQCKNCSADSAESMPPVARMGKPGSFRAMFDTALRAIGRMALPETPPYVVFFSAPTAGHADALDLTPISPDTVLVAVAPDAPPSCAAIAISTMSVTFGVSLAKKGILIAARTHRQILRTSSGSCPHARPMPRSPMPCGHERLSSSASAPEASAILASSCQSSRTYPHMMLAMTTRSGKSRFSSVTDLHQYAADFSEMSSMLRKDPWPGPHMWPLVVPRTMRGDTFVTLSLSRANVFVTAKPQPTSNARRIIAEVVVGGALARPKGLGNLMPQTSTLTSTASMGVQKMGSETFLGMGIPCSACRYVCMCQAACLPSLTDSTVVCACPARSPPQNTHGSLVRIVSLSTTGRPHELNLSGCIASITASSPSCDPNADIM
eukprot:Opistho-2@56828